MMPTKLSSADAPEMATLHVSAFPAGQAWSAADFARLLDQTMNHAYGLQRSDRLASFILIQSPLDQAEILTLATDPGFQRQGLAASLLADLEAVLASKGVSKWLLDVAADNPGALSFYQKLGFTTDGRRPAYYKRLEGARVDAILMSKPLGGQAIR